MQSPRAEKTKIPADRVEPVPAVVPQEPAPVPTVPAPAFDEDYDWDPERDPAEGLDPATTWWGG